MGRPPKIKSVRPPKIKVVAVTVKAKPPHGKSLEANPDRTPHPSIPGRDITGRIMPGASLVGAAPPFTAQTRPQSIQATPPIPPLPPVNPAGAGTGNMPSGPIAVGIPPARGMRR